MPGRYVVTEGTEDDGMLFAEKMTVLTARLAEQFGRGEDCKRPSART